MCYPDYDDGWRAGRIAAAGDVREYMEREFNQEYWADETATIARIAEEGE